MKWWTDTGEWDHGRLRRFRGDAPDFSDDVDCPACGEPLPAGQQVRCKGCDRAWDLTGPVPQLILEPKWDTAKYPRRESA